MLMGSDSAAIGGAATEVQNVEAATAPVAIGGSPHGNMAEILPSLPTGPTFPPYPMRLYGGFWLPDHCLLGVETAHKLFRPRPTDVLLASFPKSGTTWLKALCYSALNRAAHPPSSGADHPLHRGSPHDLVRLIDIASAYPGEDDPYEQLPSPRLLATHLPYSLLPHGITDEQGTGGGRIVYVCRDPKDTLVSYWHFYRKSTPPQSVPGASGVASPTFEEAFDFFCKGNFIFGPHWRHVLEYWEASRRSPDKVLFLKYEDMLRDPAGHLRTLAAFMGCPFSPEEEAAGVPHAVVRLCSLESLKGLQVTKTGSTLFGVKNDTFFRNGVAGDWSSCITPAMAARLDAVVAEALRGSTLTFGSSTAPIQD